MESPGRKTISQSFLLGGGNKLTLKDTDTDHLVPKIFADPRKDPDPRKTDRDYQKLPNLTGS